MALDGRLMNDKQERVLMDIITERVRQEDLRQAGRFRYTCAGPGLTDTERLAVLLEEVGETARATLEREGLVSDRINGADLADALRTELIQVAAVAVAWLEFLEGYRFSTPSKEG